MGIFAIDLNFSKHRKTYTVGETTEFLYFGLRLRFLCLKLVAGKPQYHQPITLVLFIEVLQTFILMGSTSFACHIYNQYDLVFEALKGKRFPINRLDRYIV